jgi:hypothetical protein
MDWPGIVTQLPRQPPRSVTNMLKAVALVCQPKLTQKSGIAALSTFCKVVIFSRKYRAIIPATLGPNPISS